MSTEKDDLLAKKIQLECNIEKCNRSIDTTCKVISNLQDKVKGLLSEVEKIKKNITDSQASLTHLKKCKADWLDKLDDVKANIKSLEDLENNKLVNDLYKQLDTSRILASMSDLESEPIQRYNLADVINLSAFKKGNISELNNKFICEIRYLDRPISDYFSDLGGISKFGTNLLEKTLLRLYCKVNNLSLSDVYNIIKNSRFDYPCSLMIFKSGSKHTNESLITREQYLDFGCRTGNNILQLEENDVAFNIFVYTYLQTAELFRKLFNTGTFLNDIELSFAMKEE